MEPTPISALEEHISENFHIALLDSAIQVPLGSLIIDVTPPSIGTARDIFCKAVGLKNQSNSATSNQLALPCHCMLIVLIIYSKISMTILTFPVRHYVKWT